MFLYTGVMYLPGFYSLCNEQSNWNCCFLASTISHPTHQPNLVAYLSLHFHNTAKKKRSRKKETLYFFLGNPLIFCCCILILSLSRSFLFLVIWNWLDFLLAEEIPVIDFCTCICRSRCGCVWFFFWMCVFVILHLICVPFWNAFSFICLTFMGWLNIAC